MSASIITTTSPVVSLSPAVAAVMSKVSEKEIAFTFEFSFIPSNISKVLSLLHHLQIQFHNRIP